jgi:hypothetical protein
VFVTYSIGFVLILSTLARPITLTPLAGVGLYGALIYLPIHMFRQLQGSYNLSFGGALWRTIILFFVSVIVALAFLAALITLGVGGL